jgi:hypothetical protein
MAAKRKSLLQCDLHIRGRTPNRLGTNMVRQLLVAPRTKGRECALLAEHYACRKIQSGLEMDITRELEIGAERCTRLYLLKKRTQDKPSRLVVRELQNLSLDLRLHGAGLSVT